MLQILDLEYEVALLYATHGTYRRVASIMIQKTGRYWSVPSVKILLMRYLRKQLDIRIGPGRPPMRGFRVPQKPILPNNSV